MCIMPLHCGTLQYACIVQVCCCGTPIGAVWFDSLIVCVPLYAIICSIQKA